MGCFDSKPLEEKKKEDVRLVEVESSPNPLFSKKNYQDIDGVGSVKNGFDSIDKKGVDQSQSALAVVLEDEVELERRKTHARAVMERNMADEERRLAEEERKQLEEERRKAEEERFKLEEERKKLEVERIKLEEEHKKAEEKRKKAETERKKRAEDRLKAEERKADSTSIKETPTKPSPNKEESSHSLSKGSQGKEDKPEPKKRNKNEESERKKHKRQPSFTSDKHKEKNEEKQKDEKSKNKEETPKDDKQEVKTSKDEIEKKQKDTMKNKEVKSKEETSSKEDKQGDPTKITKEGDKKKEFTEEKSKSKLFEKIGFRSTDKLSLSNAESEVETSTQDELTEKPRRPRLKKSEHFLNLNRKKDKTIIETSFTTDDSESDEEQEQSSNLKKSGEYSNTTHSSKKKRLHNLFGKVTHAGEEEDTMINASTESDEEDVAQSEEVPESTGNSTIDAGIAQFNEKWKTGIQFLKSNGIVENVASIAKFLFDYNKWLSKEQLGEILSGEKEDDTEILKEFTYLLNFKGISFEAALRKFLQTFMLPGEAQKISRVMERFAIAYHEQNPEIFPNSDVCFILAFALIMLNTDAHNPAIAPKDKMTIEQFIRNNRGTWVDGTDPPTELLENLYESIIDNEIKMLTKGEPDKKGWLKGIKAGSYKEGKCWFLVVNNELTWYKDPTMRRMKGKLSLEYLQVEESEEKCRFYITSILSAHDVQFIVYEVKDASTTKEVGMHCKRFKVQTEDQKQVRDWSKAVREHVQSNILNQNM